MNFLAFFILVSIALFRNSSAFLSPRNVNIPSKNVFSVAVRTTKGQVEFPPFMRSDVHRVHYFSLASFKNDDDAAVDSQSRSEASLFVAVVFFAVAALYWYMLVFAAALASAGFPVPSFISLTPGWPPSDLDLAPAVEDSIHFFYLSDLLETLGSVSDDGLAETAQASITQPTVRFAVFNLAEAWIFAMLPALLADKRRLPLPVVIATWLGALGLTNAFLTPYLAFRELFASNLFGTERTDDFDGVGGRNAVLSPAFGAISLSVVGFATMSAFGASPEQWADFGELAVSDRTYTAFCVDLVLFSVIQPFLLRCATAGYQKETPAVYNIPFIGLLAWLFGT